MNSTPDDEDDAEAEAEDEPEDEEGGAVGGVASGGGGAITQVPASPSSQHGGQGVMASSRSLPSGFQVDLGTDALTHQVRK